MGQRIIQLHMIGGYIYLQYCANVGNVRLTLIFRGLQISLDSMEGAARSLISNQRNLKYYSRCHNKGREAAGWNKNFC